MEKSYKEENYKIERIVRDWSFFEGFSNEEIHRSVCCMTLHHVRAGEVIFQEGDMGDYLFFIMGGAVDIIHRNNDGVQKVASLGEGALVGEVSFFDGYHRSADAIARTTSEILILSTTTLKRLIQEDEHLGIKLLMRLGEIVSQRLRRMVGDKVEAGSEVELNR